MKYHIAHQKRLLPNVLLTKEFLLFPFALFFFPINSVYKLLAKYNIHSVYYVRLKSTLAVSQSFSCSLFITLLLLHSFRITYNHTAKLIFTNLSVHYFTLKSRSSHRANLFCTTVSKWCTKITSLAITAGSKDRLQSKDRLFDNFGLGFRPPFF